MAVVQIHLLISYRPPLYCQYLFDDLIDRI